jgi:hypothetical protein
MKMFGGDPPQFRVSGMLGSERMIEFADSLSHISIVASTWQCYCAEGW